jgi:hypothetical protein
MKLGYSILDYPDYQNVRHTSTLPSQFLRIHFLNRMYFIYFNANVILKSSKLF